MAPPPTEMHTADAPTRAAAVVAAGIAVVALAVAIPAPLGIVGAAVALVWAATAFRLATCPALARRGALAAAVGGLVSWAGAVANAEVRSGPGGWLVDATLRIGLSLLPVLTADLVLSLPDGRLPSPNARRLVGIAALASVAVGLALMVERDHVVAWPIAVLWFLPVAALPAARRRYLRSDASDRRRLQWFGWAIALGVEIALVVLALDLLVDWPRHVPSVLLATSALAPLSLLAAANRRMSARVDQLLTHTVSLAGLTVLVLGSYATALAAFGRAPDNGERALLLLSMAAAAGASVAYQPVRRWLGERANRVVYGERVSPDEALRTWGSRLTRSIPLDELLLQLTEALRKSMSLRSARVWTGSSGRYEVSAGVPHRALAPLAIADKELNVVSRAGVSGGTWVSVWLPGLVPDDDACMIRVAPIAHGGELLGLIVCERPSGGPQFNDDEDRLLGELARQVGLALHNVQLDAALQASLDELRSTNEELRASRARVVAAADDARRKLERNLHDGAQQHLVALAVKVRLAKDALADDPEDAEALLDEIRGDVQGAIAELRSLAHGIFPPLLMSGGLAEALPAAATRMGPCMRADVTGVGRHLPEVEAAVYFSCSEAMQNAAKHAGPEATVALRVWEHEHVLRWEVCDDGPGFDPSTVEADGHGFVNMRDRMGSIGGQLSLRSAPGSGTTVSGAVPV